MAEDTMYLSVGNDEKGRLIAIITLGQPQLGDSTCKVLTLTTVKNMKEAKKWYKRMKIEQPWVTRQ